MSTKITRTTSQGRPYSILMNPTPEQLAGRGVTQMSDFRILTKGSDIYVWNTFQATWEEVERYLKIKADHRLRIRDNHFDLWTDPHVMSMDRIAIAFPNSSINTFDNKLTEAPISDISHVGNWEKNSSFRDKNDRKLLTSVKALANIKKMWKYPQDENFNIILVNNADANQHTELGIVEMDRLPVMFPRSWDVIEPYIKPDEVNIIFTNNKGAERVPMTGWIMAHRYGHALMRNSYYMKETVPIFLRYLTDILANYGVKISNNDLLKNGPHTALLYSICTFRSARNRELRTPFEALYELFAQYIFSGKLVFNPLPASFLYHRQTYRYQEDDRDTWGQYVLDDMNDELVSHFDTAMRYSVGKVLVM